MISHLFIFESEQFNPYINLATEKFLFDNLPKDSAILYLWQNDNTVVIGKNQNPWNEINCDLFLSSGGFVARRMTGGGAVFHDKGNLNFTFISGTEDYSKEIVFGIIIAALKKLGINAQISGRNDILTGGKKFSGNAFYHTKDKSLHHGTLLISSTAEKIEKYLTPNKEKLKAKGVKSVSSRVINLNEINPNITPELLRKQLIKAAEKELRLEAENTLKINESVIENTANELSCWDYIFGSTLPFSVSFSRNFSFGITEINLNFENGKFKDIKVYTDSLDIDIPNKFITALKGCELKYEKITERLREFFDNKETEEILEAFKNNLL